MAADLGDLIARILLDSKEFQIAMKGVESQAQETAEKANKNLAGLSSGLDGIANAAAGLAAAMGLAHLIGEVEDYAKELRNLDKSFTAMTGSASDAKEVLGELGEIAKSSPFEFPTVAEAAKNMMLLRVSSDTAVVAIKGIVDAVSALKLGAPAVGQISEALALMSSRGEVTTKAMQTLARSGLDAWQMLADGIGTTVPNAMNLVKTHAISMDQFLRDMAAGMEKNFAGAAARAAATWAGTWKNIKEGALTAGASIMQSVTDVMNRLAPLLKPVVTLMDSLADKWKTLPGPVRDAVAALGIAVGAFMGLVTSATALIGAGAAVGAAITAAATAVGLAVTPFLAIAAAVGVVVGAFVLLGSWISAHWSGISTAVTEAWDGLKEIWGGVWDSIVTMLTAVWGVLSGVAERAFQKTTQFLATVWDGVTALWKGAWDVILGALRFAWNAIVLELAIFDKILAYLVPFWEPVKTAFKAAWDSISGMLTTAWGKLRDTATVVWTAIGKVTDDAVDKQVAAAKKQKDVLTGLATDYEKAAGQLGIKTTAQLTSAYEAAVQSLEAMKKASAEAVKAGGEKLSSDKDLLAAQLKVNEAYKNMLEGDKALQESQKKTAEEAKRAAAEKDKDAAAAVARQKKMEAADEKLEESVLKLGATATKAWQQIQKESDQTVAIVVANWDRWGRSSPAGSFTVAQLALKELGVTSTAVYTRAIKDAEAYAADVKAAFEQNTASAEDYQSALDVVKAKQKALADYTNRELVGAFKTLGIESAAALQKTASEALTAYNKVVASNVPADIAAAWLKVKAAQQAVVDHVNKEMIDAYHLVGLKTTQELDKLASDAAIAYGKIAEANKKGSQAELTARVAALEAAKAAHERHGEAWSKEDQRQLNDAQRRLEAYHKKAKDLWGDFFKHIEELGKKFKNDVLDKIFDRLFGPDQNAALKKQEAELTASLAERAGEWDKYVADNATKMKALNDGYETAMQKQADDTAKALGDAAKDYDDYAKDVAQNIDDIKQKHADAAAEETQAARDALADKQQDYADYADEVAQNIEDIHKNYADQLEAETESLSKALDDQRQEYEDYVEDANKSLARLGQDTATNISDETQDTQENIADRTKDYTRYAQDVAKKISDLRLKNKGAYSDEEGDLMLSLQRKKEDLDQYTAEQNEKLERYVRDQKTRQSREEEDLHESLDRKSRDFDEYVAENAKKQEDAVTAYHEGQDREVQKQLDSLASKKKDLDEFTADTIAKIDDIQTSHAKEQDAEVLKQQEALAQKKSDYDQHVADILAKSDEQAAGIKADYDGNVADLQAALQKERDDYDAFVKDITGPEGKLAQLKAQHTTVWSDIGTLATGALDEIGKSILHLASDEVIGLLTGKTKGLKQIWDDLKSVVDGVGTSASKAAGNVPGGGGGGGESPGGGAGSAVGAVAGGLTGWVTAISGAVTAISSVIGNFQMAKMETSLNAIEHNTRYTMMYVGERADGGILGVLFKIDEELAWGANTKATEKLRDLFNDWTGVVNPIFTAIQTAIEGIAPYIVDSKTALEDIGALAADLPRVVTQGFRELNVTVTATGATTAEAARVLGNQIAANLSRQLVPVS